MFDAEFGYVCRSLRRLGVHSPDLPDVAQELFVSVHAKLTDYDPAKPVKPWLFSFSIRYASNYRKLARHRSVEFIDGAHGSHSGRGIEEKDLLLRALDALDFDQRDAVVMHDIEGFSAPEIAELLSTPLNTIYSRVRLGREKLRSAVLELQAPKEKAS